MEESVPARAKVGRDGICYTRGTNTIGAILFVGSHLGLGLIEIQRKGVDGCSAEPSISSYHGISENDEFFKFEIRGEHGPCASW